VGCANGRGNTTFGGNVCVGNLIIKLLKNKGFVEAKLVEDGARGRFYFA
jgi:hypothetical protein